ncbi:MAG: hypothetical protein ACE5EX_11220 [Phycisphaerae bacterium]
MAGPPIPFDDLHAALGLCWTVTAVPWEPDPARWPLYARDAFLIPTGRLFGLSLREIHPPEAARGLPDHDEFRQHFDASYRPLILRALEHGQSVLAWGGWDRGRELMWGLIRETCAEGVGFRGLIHRAGAPPATAAICAAAPSEGEAEPALLAGPAVQVYVVEDVTPATPSADDLLGLALDHARRTISNELHDRLGVLTGPTALDLWARRLSTAHPSEAEKFIGSDAMRCLFRQAVFDHDTVIRFLQTRGAGRATTCVHDIPALIEVYTELAGILRALADVCPVDSVLLSAVDAKRMADRLARVGKLSVQIGSTLAGPIATPRH